MIGTITNTLTILTGSLIGSTLKKGIRPEYQATLMQAMGLAASALGISNIAANLPESEYPVLFIISLAIGALLGQIAKIDIRFQRLVGRFSGGGNLAQGLSTAVLLFCIGTLSILGPIESALHQNHTFLFTNAILDLVTSTVLASNFGIGIALAAPILFCWQGAIYLFAGVIEPFLTPALMTEISALGGILILSSGISILGIQKINTMNLLPSLLVPPVFFLLKSLL